MPANMNLVTTNDCRQLDVSCCCRASVLRFRTSCVLGARAGGYKWQYILIATFSSSGCISDYHNNTGKIRHLTISEETYNNEQHYLTLHPRAWASSNRPTMFFDRLHLLKNLYPKEPSSVQPLLQDAGA